MSRLYKRTINVAVWRMSTPPATAFNPRPLGEGEQLDISELKVKFKVVRDFSRHPNSSDVEIYNLSPATRADLQTRPLKVQLTAGYGGENRLLTTGDVRYAQSKQDGPNWVTLLQLADGGRTYGVSRINKSYPAGTTYRQVLRDISAAMGLQLPPALARDVDLDRKFVAGNVASGPARDELSKLLAPFGYAWSIQNGALRILADDQTVSNSPLIIGEEQGMIGTPEFGSPPKSGKPPHMSVKVLLYPELIPGDLIELRSKAAPGRYKVVKITHSGDTHGSDWVTEAEIKPI